MLAMVIWFIRICWGEYDIYNPRVQFVSTEAEGWGGYELHPRGVNIVFPEVDADKGFMLFQPRMSDFFNKFDRSLRLRISYIENQVRNAFFIEHRMLSPMTTLENANFNRHSASEV